MVFGIEDDAQGTQRIVLISEVKDPVERKLEDISDDISKQTFLRMGVSISDIELVKHGTLAKTSSGKRRHRHFKQMYIKGELEAYRAEAASIEA